MARVSASIIRLALPPLIGVTLIGSSASSGRAAETVSQQDAHAIGVAAYTYFYSLVTMDVTRKQLTNVVKAEGLTAPMNVFANVPTYPTADTKAVVRPNFDTLYSSAWLDLTKEPMIVSVPDTNGRYYLLPMLDMWTDVFASPGWRTTGTQAADYALVPPGWTGSLPVNVVRINAPTPYVWIIGRIKTDGPPDYAAVNKLQAGLKITPASRWDTTAEPVAGTVDPAVDMKTPPKTTVDTMPAGKFFAYAAEILKLQPPHLTDQPIVAQVASLARVVNGWSMNTDTMGVYGNYYLKRAIVTQLGLGANVPEDAIYPINLADGTGKPLDGASAYVLHFDRGATPPANAFWSVTLYDSDGFQVANSLDRFAVSSWMPFKYDPDGSLDLYFQNISPGADKEANWLPAPKGEFNLTMRLYAPKSDALTGKWNPPAVTKAAQPTLLPTQ
jgi:hypothetical protein